MGSSSPGIPQPPPPPDIDDEEIRRKALEERQRLRKLKGRSSTILTGGLGASSEADLKKTTLLGGKL